MSAMAEGIFLRSESQAKTQKYDSIKTRRRNVLGTISFMPPMTTKRSREKSVVSETQDLVPVERRRQVYLSQRNHRKRMKDYMDALEEEVHRLRNEKDDLNRIADSWKRCFQLLSSLVPFFRSQTTVLMSLEQLDPRLLLFCNVVTLSANHWPLRDSASSLESLGRHFTGHNKVLGQPMSPFTQTKSNQLHHFDLEETLGFSLFQNFCEAIIPTLSFTKSVSDGYYKYVLPLSIGNNMALCGILASSASHLRLTMGTVPLDYPLKYRSAALQGLRNAALDSNPDSSASLVALTTILGLLIDDMITSSFEFPALIQLINFWTSMHGSLNYDSHEMDALQFLSNQISIMKHMISPLYHISLSSLRGNMGHQPRLAMLDTSKLCETFSALQDATELAAQIYLLSRSNLDSHGISDPMRTSSKWTSDPLDPIDGLLNTLKLRVKDLQPYGLGEDKLVWVYYIAAMNSVSTRHRLFFTSKLANVLERMKMDG